MPQLDITWYPAQFFWMLITFSMMLFLFSKVVIPRIAKVVDERQKRIDEDIARAEKLKKEAEEITKAYKKVMSEAETMALDHMQKVKNEITELVEQREKEMTIKLETKIKSGEEKIARVREDILGQVRDISLDTTHAVAKKFAKLGKKSTSFEEVVDNAIKEHIS